MAATRASLLAGVCAQLRTHNSKLLGLKRSDRNDGLEDKHVPVTLYMTDPYERSEENALSVQRQCEELVLLTVLVRVDADAWQGTMLGIWNYIWDEEDDERDFRNAAKIAKPFAFGLEVTAAAIPVLQGLLRGTPAISTTRYGLLKSAISLGALEAGESHLQAPVRIVLDFKKSSVDPSKRLQVELQTILTLVQATTARVSANVSPPPIFRVEEVTIDHYSALSIGEDTIDIMKQLVACGVRLHVLPRVENCSPRKVLEATHVHMPPFLPLSGSPGVSTVVVSDSSSKESIPALLSALTVSQSVRRVDLVYGSLYDDAARHTFWRGVAYALFSQNARNNVRHIHVEPRCMYPEDIELMRPLVEAKNPLAVLMGEDPNAAAERTWIEASRFVFAPPRAAKLRDAAPSPTSEFTSDQPLVVSAIGKVDRAWVVILPGYGKAWVRDQDARVVENMTETPPAFSRDLKVSCELIPIDEDKAESTEAMVSLLSLIGERVGHLELLRSPLSMEPFLGERPDWLEDILLSCRHLKEVTIGEVAIGNLNVFVDDPDVPQLRKLVIEDNVFVLDNLANIDRFFAALSDPSHRLMKSLQELEYLSDSQCDEFIELVCKLCRCNTRMYRLVVSVLPDDDSEYVESDIDTVFEVQEEEEDTMCTVSVALESKLAFFNVLPYVASGNIIDRGPVTTIFEFAGETRKREFRYRLKRE